MAQPFTASADVAFAERTKTRSELRATPAYQAYQILHAAFVIAPILAGIDKFLHLLTNWDVYLAPRKVIGSLKGIEIVEMPRNGTRGMCCGAGGARMWMEESIGTKVNDERAREALSTGATRVATACPFCYIMLDDGVKGAGFDDDQVKVADISMHLIDAIERGEAAFHHPEVPLIAD